MLHISYLTALRGICKYYLCLFNNVLVTVSNWMINLILAHMVMYATSNAIPTNQWAAYISNTASSHSSFSNLNMAIHNANSNQTDLQSACLACCWTLLQSVIVTQVPHCTLNLKDRNHQRWHIQNRIIDKIFLTISTCYGLTPC